MDRAANNDGQRAGESADAPPVSPPRTRRRLFYKYAVLFGTVVSLVLLTHAGLQTWFAYREQQAALARAQVALAEGAAAKIGAFLAAIEDQIGWTTQLPVSSATLDQHRLDAVRLLRQVPAITEFTQVAPDGRELLRVSRLAADVVGGGADLSADPVVAAALAGRRHISPVYFRQDSEPYLNLALSGSRRSSGVSMAAVNLKFIWDVVSQIRVGRAGVAYVVDGAGRLIAHPDISLVLRRTDLVTGPEAAGAPVLEDSVRRPGLDGMPVLSTSVRLPGLEWRVFVDVPLDEARAPLIESLERTALLLFAGLGVALVAALVLARRIVVPIRALQAGATRIGQGDLGHRVTVNTADELEDLADQFNTMSDDLRESRARAARMDRFRRFLSPQLAQVIESAGGESLLTSHRQNVTALFCDLRGFTAFAEAVEPEDVMTVLNEYHAELGALIHKYEGTLERFVGDGLLVLFNDPLPCPDPQMRGVRMAVEMRSAIAGLAIRWRRYGQPLGFGIGIAHGMATLGRIGFEGRFDYSAIGTVVNLAARLCNEARDGQILIDDAIRVAVAEAADTQHVGDLALKGLRNPVPAYNVVSIRL